MPNREGLFETRQNQRNFLARPKEEREAEVESAQEEAFAAGGEDLRNIDYTRKILESGTPEQQEAVRIFYRWSPEQLRLAVDFSILRKEIHQSMDNEMQQRIETDLSPAKEEVAMGRYKENIEPQVRDAVLALRQKGYATYSSGFDGCEVQSIDFRENHLAGFQFPQELQRALMERGARVEVNPDRISFSCDRLVSADELRQIWNQIADILPNLGKEAEPASLPMSYALKKGLEWKRRRENADQVGDDQGEKIEEGIKETAVAVNVLGLTTSGSCEGHADRGEGPWVEIGTPNEPAERYKGQGEAEKRIALKYGIPVEDIQKGRLHLEGVRDAVNEVIEESSPNGETEAYQEWREKNNLLEENASKLLEEFYQHRESVAPDARLIIKKFDAGGQFSIRNAGEFLPVSAGAVSGTQISENERRLVLYREEMKQFTDFLRRKFFHLEGA